MMLLLLNIHYLCSPVVLIGVAGTLGLLLHSHGIFPLAHHVATCTKAAAVQELNVDNYNYYNYMTVLDSGGNCSRPVIINIIVH